MDDKDYWFADEQDIRDRYWHIQPGQVVMDVGCHIGSYSIPALTAGAVVYAVDPCEPRLTQLRRLWDGDPARLTTVAVALAEPGGYTPGFRASLAHAAFAEFHAPPGATFSTLDGLAAEHRLTRLDWVKIDVEGAELGVLAGGVESLARFRPVLLIEAHDKVYKFVAAMDSQRRCHDLLAGLGYTVEVVPYYGRAQTVDRDFWICRPRRALHAHPSHHPRRKAIAISIYARSDLMSVAVPSSSGGCGATHTRPVTHGAPAKIWKLDCPSCESHLRGDRKPKLLRHIIEGGRVVGQERVPDADPMWSTTPETAPLTPDEERTNAVRSERGRMQIEMLQALAALRSTGVEVPAEAMWLLERELPAGVLKGTVVCADGHDVPAGNKFCPECGISMAAKAAIGTPKPKPEPERGEPAMDLTRLHVQSLRKMARERGLPDKGSKVQLIQRLAA